MALFDRVRQLRHRIERVCALFLWNYRKFLLFFYPFDKLIQRKQKENRKSYFPSHLVLLPHHFLTIYLPPSLYLSPSLPPAVFLSLFSLFLSVVLLFFLLIKVFYTSEKKKIDQSRSNNYQNLYIWQFHNSYYTIKVNTFDVFKLSREGTFKPCIH